MCLQIARIRSAASTPVTFPVAAKQDRQPISPEGPTIDDAAMPGIGESQNQGRADAGAACVVWGLAAQGAPPTTSRLPLG